MKLTWDIKELTDFGKRIGDIAKFETYCKQATRELAKVFQDMLIKKTPVRTGNLASGWGGATNSSYKVVQSPTGFMVTLENNAANDNGFMYANAVNYGHYSYNQFGGAYEVKHRTVPYYSGNGASTFVYGHFFLEKSILELENSSVLEEIVYKELEKWFRWCLGGK